MKETVVYNKAAMKMMQQFSLIYYEHGMTQTRNKIINSLSAKEKMLNWVEQFKYKYFFVFSFMIYASFVNWL